MSQRPTLAAIRRPSDGLAVAPVVPIHSTAPPAEVPKAREINVYSACKMPLSMFEAIGNIAHAHHVTKSDVIRYFVEEGLRSPFAAGTFGAKSA